MPDAAGTASVETRQSWMIAIAALTMLAMAAGAPLIVVVGLVPISETLGGGRSLPSLASSVAYMGSGIGGVVCGLLAARFGQRRVAMMGGIAICAGLFLASLGHSWSLLAGIGIGVGIFGNGALFPPMFAYVSLWFDRRRGTALALVSSGQYIAGFLWPFLFERAIAAYGWQRTMQAYGILAACVVLVVAALVLRPAPMPQAGPGGIRTVGGGRVLGMAPNMAMFLIAACSFLCCVPMAMPAAHLVAFCGDLGISAARGCLDAVRAAAERLRGAAVLGLAVGQDRRAVDGLPGLDRAGGGDAGLPRDAGRGWAVLRLGGLWPGLRRDRAGLCAGGALVLPGDVRGELARAHDVLREPRRDGLRRLARRRDLRWPSWLLRGGLVGGNRVQPRAARDHDVPEAFGLS
jgi:MFS family permease